MFGDEIWDENEWEAFLRKDDDRIERYMKLLNRFLSDHPLPKTENDQDNQAWRDAFKAYLIQHGLPFEEFEAGQFQADNEEQEEHSPIPFDLPTEDLIMEEDREAFESLQQIPVYQLAYDLTTYVLSWSDGLPGETKDSVLVQFCSSIMQVTANIAKGHGMGYDLEVLGGNIACLKRGIKAANTALDLLREMKGRRYFTPAAYADLYERTYEVRNSVGLHIQDLRDRFNLGID
ncbi:MAG: four helix bundle protein [Bacteroidota bacterium]